MDLTNCFKCGKLMVNTGVTDLCRECLQEEEKDFEKVSQFLRQKENRSATMQDVVDATGVEEELIHKFIRKGRIMIVHFPNLGYPCELCGTLIKSGKLCSSCSKDLKNELHTYEQTQARKKDEKSQIYYAIDEKYRKR